MKYGFYYLFGILLAYLLVDLDPMFRSEITKKKFFEISKWDNTTINNIVINKDKDIALTSFDFHENKWFNKNNLTQECELEMDNNLCQMKRITKHKNIVFTISLPKNHIIK